MIIFVNGYTLGCEPYRPYWSSSKKNPDEFIEAAKDYFQDDHIEKESFVNGSGDWFGSMAWSRQASGRNLAKGFWKEVKPLLKPNETLKFICHSMGSAFAEGMIEYLVSQMVRIEKVIHLATADAKNIKIPETTRNIYRLQVNTTDDIIIEQVANRFYTEEKQIIPHISKYGKVKWDPWYYHKEHMEYISRHALAFNLDSHFDTKTYAFVFDWVRTLENLELNEPIGTRNFGKTQCPVYEIPRSDFRFDRLMIDKKYLTYLENYKENVSDKFVLK